jgi:hypothetical protein
VDAGRTPQDNANGRSANSAGQRGAAGGGTAQAGMMRCIFTDWSSPMPTQMANIDEPP